VFFANYISFVPTNIYSERVLLSSCHNILLKKKEIFFSTYLDIKTVTFETNISHFVIGLSSIPVILKLDKGITVGSFRDNCKGKYRMYQIVINNSAIIEGQIQVPTKPTRNKSATEQKWYANK